MPCCTRCSPIGSPGPRPLPSGKRRPGRYRRTGTTRSWGGASETPCQLYGGDLDGIVEHLDHIASLGANTIYLTPVFPAQSNHRYDAAGFDRVDPVLGGDEALARLTDAAHARGMRVMGDFTTNHCGDAHEWFRTASTDENSAEAGFFLFHTHPTDYVAWFDHPSLPKFDHRNPELRRRLYEGPDSVVARWLAAPAALDGWRIDVANMTGRHGTVDLNHEVATSVRRTMAAARPDSLLIAEHSHDASPDLLGDGWHGVMNYAAFTRPLWQWLTPEGPVEFTPGPFTAIPRLPGTAVAATMREFAAAVPWRSTAAASTSSGRTTPLGSPPLSDARTSSRSLSVCSSRCRASRCSTPATRSAKRASTVRTAVDPSLGLTRAPGTPTFSRW